VPRFLPRWVQYGVAPAYRHGRRAPEHTRQNNAGGTARSSASANRRGRNGLCRTQSDASASPGLRAVARPRSGPRNASRVVPRPRLGPAFAGPGAARRAPRRFAPVLALRLAACSPRSRAARGRRRFPAGGSRPRLAYGSRRRFAPRGRAVRAARGSLAPGRVRLRWARPRAMRAAAANTRRRRRLAVPRLSWPRAALALPLVASPRAARPMLRSPCAATAGAVPAAAALPRRSRSPRGSRGGAQSALPSANALPPSGRAGGPKHTQSPTPHKNHTDKTRKSQPPDNQERNTGHDASCDTFSKSLPETKAKKPVAITQVIDDNDDIRRTLAGNTHNIRTHE
jgi:hypothetical protein